MKTWWGWPWASRCRRLRYSECFLPQGRRESYAQGVLCYCTTCQRVGHWEDLDEWSGRRKVRSWWKRARFLKGRGQAGCIRLPFSIRKCVGCPITTTTLQWRGWTGNETVCDKTLDKNWRSRERVLPQARRWTLRTRCLRDQLVTASRGNWNGDNFCFFSW